MQGCRLTANEIACRRGDRLLLRALSFTLEPGEALHLTGSNGIGKTSLIRILAGLATPYAGTVAGALRGRVSTRARPMAARVASIRKARL